MEATTQMDESVTQPRSEHIPVTRMSRCIAVFLPPGAVLSTVAAPTDLLQLADGFARERTGQQDGATRNRNAALACRWLSRDGAAVTLSSGSSVSVDGAIDTTTVYDAVFIGAFGDAANESAPLQFQAHADVSAWLLRQHEAGATIAAFGNAVLFLAEAGLLDGRAATVPWWQQHAFHRRYPAVRIDASQQITQAGRILCASTLSALFPLSLRVVQTLTSPNAAEWLANTTLIDPKDRVDTPRSAPMQGIDSADALVARAQYHLQQHYAEHAQLGDLAAALSVSPRTLVRRFRRALGMTPQAYTQHLRIESAKRMLVRTTLHVDRVARQVGYNDAAFFKRVFRQQTGVTPAHWRLHMLESGVAHETP